MRIDAAACTDPGLVRTNNEDAHGIEPALNLFVLSDGIGGAAQGELASSLAVETVITHCQEAENSRSAPLFVDPKPELCDVTNRLASAVAVANRRIYDAARVLPDRRGMGATLVAARLHDSRLSLVHVGDSRAYLLRSGSLEQLTADHSLVAEQVRTGLMTPQEAENSSLQNVLTRALGICETVVPDADEQVLTGGDILLLCSDGLTRMVTDPEIAATLLTIHPACASAERLVALANEYGGQDNVTVIVVRILPEPDGFLSRLRRWV